MKHKYLLKDPAIHGSAAGHYLHLFFILFVFWFLLCGQFGRKDFLLGICISAVISYLCFPLLMLQSRKSGKKYFVFQVSVVRLLFYGVWMLREIIHSNLMVAAAILQEKNKIDPKLAEFRMPMDHPMAHVLLANSITLTPGTVTLDVTEDGIYTVHALNEAMAGDLLSGRIQRKVAVLFGENPAEYESRGILGKKEQG